MAEATSLHLRPIFASNLRTKVYAVSDTQLLLRRDLLDHVIARIEQTEEDDGLVITDTPPKKSIRWPFTDSRSLSFLDSRTLCFIERPEYKRFFVVTRAADDFFQTIVDRKVYPLDVHGEVDSLKVIGTTAFLATCRPNLDEPGSLMELWKFEVPPATSYQHSLEIHKCGRYFLGVAGVLRTSETNGRLHVGQLYQPERQPEHQNVVGDVQTGVYHTISGVEHDDIQIVADFAVRFSFSRRYLGLTKCDLDKLTGQLRLTDYAAPLPLPTSDLNKVWAGKTKVHVAKSCSHFFLTRQDRILMGYLPGADISLEDVAAAAIWRSFPTSAQEDLLSSNQLSKRQILLRAMKEEEQRRNGQN